MKTSRITRAWRLSRLVLHLVLGIVEAALFFRWRDARGRALAITRWSRRMCKILRIEVSTRGAIPALSCANTVVVANHVSWLDIFVLNTVTVSRFVAKAEVRSWPLLGWMCQQTGTLFVAREKRQDTQRVNREISNALAGGDSIAVFPEGSTTDGYDVIPFNASLLQPAVDAGAQLAPVALRYYGFSGMRTMAAAYVGDMSLLESIMQILAEPSMCVRLDFLPLISTHGCHRRDLARHAQAEISTIVLQDSPIAAKAMLTSAVVAELTQSST